MQKDINLKGVSFSPSDIACEDGQLAACVNLVNEDSVLKPLPNPMAILTLPSADYYVRFIHKNAGYSNYIIGSLSQPESLWWLPSGFKTFPEETDLIPLHQFDTPVSQIQSVGNTLIILTNEGLSYALWKNDDYINLGSELPECSLSFGLQGEAVRSDRVQVDIYEARTPTDLWGTPTFSEENKEKITNNVLGPINKFIKEESIEKGRFLYPFLVRYAFRMYDGSLICHSAPVLMPCSMGVTPSFIMDSNSDVTVGMDYYHFRVGAILHQLDVSLLGNTMQFRETMELWKDIITSVDIFVSAPIYTYDQNGKVEFQFKQSFTSEYLNNFTWSFCRFHIEDSITETGDDLNLYGWHNQQLAYLKQFPPEEGWENQTGNGKICIRPPEVSGTDVFDNIKNTANFYFLKSFKPSELSGIRKVIEVPKNYLEALTARERMSDDSNSFQRLMPNYMHTYNSRLSLANVRKSVYASLHTLSLLPYSNKDTQSVRFYFFIKSGSQEYTVSSVDISPFTTYGQLLWLYYPNPDAYKVVLIRNQSQIFEADMQPSEVLDGAYACVDWDGIFNSEPEDLTDENRPSSTRPEDCWIDQPSKIYTSEINNPFYFPVTSVSTVGAGSIIGLASAARPLSQGQFGQFPLYAFTDEGVWALEVSDTGTYIARQPITRDVCINPDSITPIDSAVLFATKRGVMLIKGSEVAPLTDPIFNPQTQRLLDMPGLGDLIRRYATTSASRLVHKSADSFNPFPVAINPGLESIRIAYDYTNQRIFIFEPHISGYSPSGWHEQMPIYVYSLKSKMWSMANFYHELGFPVNSYPEAYVMSNDGKLLDLAKDSFISSPFVVTRPLTLDEPHVLKTVNTLICRGVFRRGAVRCALYGSNDLQNWHIVASSVSNEIRNISGTPYKWFRVALFSDLTSGEVISSLTVSYRPRLTNRLR